MPSSSAYGLLTRDHVEPSLADGRKWTESWIPSKPRSWWFKWEKESSITGDIDGTGTRFAGSSVPKLLQRDADDSEKGDLSASDFTGRRSDKHCGGSKQYLHSSASDTGTLCTDLGKENENGAGKPDLGIEAEGDPGDLGRHLDMDFVGIGGWAESNLSRTVNQA